MELLYELETQADEFIVDRMRWTIADALSNYNLIPKECDLVMVRHHCYERTIITKYGEMRLDVPVFRRGDCSAMPSGIDVIGRGQMRKRYSKKYAMRRVALGMIYGRIGNLLGAPRVLCASR